MHPFQDIPLALWKLAATEKQAAPLGTRRQIYDSIAIAWVKAEVTRKTSPGEQVPWDHQNAMPRWAVVQELFVVDAVETEQKHEAVRAFSTPCLTGSRDVWVSISRLSNAFNQQPALNQQAQC